MTGWQALGNAVVIQACKDYRAERKRLCVNPKDTYARAEVARLEEFFRSQRFNLFTDLDGPALLSKLKEEGGDEA